MHVFKSVWSIWSVRRRRSFPMKMFGLILVSCFLLAGCSGSVDTTNANANANASNVTPANTTAVDGSDAQSSQKGAYPPAVVEEFVTSCEDAGSDRKFCTCVLEKIQGRYSFEEFSEIESKLMAGSPVEEFAEFTGKARAECTK